MTVSENMKHDLHNGLHLGERERIAAAPIFSKLSPEDITMVLDQSIVVTRNDGEMLFSQGEPANAFYVVIEGWVKVFRTSISGDEAVVGMFKAGETVAEAAFFLRGDYPASAQCVSNCRLLKTTMSKMAEWIEHSSSFAFGLMASNSHHLHLLVQQLEQLKLNNGAQRLAAFLLSLTDKRDSINPVTVRLPFDKTVLASHIGLQPESLSRAFRQLKGKGVNVSGKMVEIGQPRNLTEFCEL